MAIIKSLAAAALALSTALASYTPRTPEMPINYEPRVMPAPAAWSFVEVPREVQTPKPVARPAAKRNAEPVCKVERRKLRMTGTWVTTWECAKLRGPCKFPSERGTTGTMETAVTADSIATLAFKFISLSVALSILACSAVLSTHQLACKPFAERGTTES